MGILSCHSASWCCVVNLRAKLVDKSLSSNPSKLSAVRKQKFVRIAVKSEWEFLKYPHLDSNSSKGFDQNQGFKSSNALKGSSESYNSYVIDGAEGGGIVTESGDSVPKVLIPSLQGESDGDSGAPIRSCFWEWKPKLNVHYEKSGSENISSPAVLFLPGFGVGSFHYEKQLKDLGRDSRAWALDFLGQGMSLPCEDPTPQATDRDKAGGENYVWGFGDETEPWAKELVYSIDLWQDQVQYFIEELYVATDAEHCYG
ncbi:unnamed protein product [Ilex paraguariensis]|uniref:Uncharacterized protein n=1 Tax=Ilex paraguariensis TaxID=185542 RepID=A0ABC8RRG0_9AQUA